MMSKKNVYSKKKNERNAFIYIIYSFVSFDDDTIHRVLSKSKTHSHKHTNTHIYSFHRSLVHSKILHFDSIFTNSVYFVWFSFFSTFSVAVLEFKTFCVYKVIIKNSTPKLFWSPLIEYKEHRSGIKRKPSDREYEVTFHL